MAIMVPPEPLLTGIGAAPLVLRSTLTKVVESEGVTNAHTSPKREGVVTLRFRSD